MTILFSPADDTPVPHKPDPTPTIHAFMREVHFVTETGGNVGRMVNAFRAGDPSWTAAVRRMHVAAARNAIEAYTKTLDALEAEVLPVRAVPVANPFGRRLPAVVSPEAVS